MFSFNLVTTSADRLASNHPGTGGHRRQGSERRLDQEIRAVVCVPCSVRPTDVVLDTIER